MRRTETVAVEKSECGGRPVHAPEVSAELFDYFLDVRVQVEGRLSRSMVLHKALSIYQDYCEIKKGLGQVPDTLTPNDRWLSDWRKSHRISFKHPNKVSIKNLFFIIIFLIVFFSFLI